LNTRALRVLTSATPSARHCHRRRGYRVVAVVVAVVVPRGRCGGNLVPERNEVFENGECETARALWRLWGGALDEARDLRGVCGGAPQHPPAQATRSATVGARAIGHARSHATVRYDLAPDRGRPSAAAAARRRRADVRLHDPTTITNPKELPPG
jgi:hypothetical protein